MTFKHSIGVDVSSDWLDIDDGSSLSRIPNTQAAIDDFFGQPCRKGARVVFEHTGRYGRCLHRALDRNGMTFVVLPTHALAAYRLHRGRKAKTDGIDARLLAELSDADLARYPTHRAEPDWVLSDLSTRRRQLRDMLQAERCRLQQADNAFVAASHEELIAFLQNQMAAVEAAIQSHIGADQKLARTAALLRTLKGIGPVSVLTLLADLPELGQRSGKQIAALVGLAPIDRQSGKRRARSTTGHGRPDVRRVLFNAARCATRHNPVLRAFYQRLVNDNNRPGKVALTAVMRKMLVTLNAITRDQQSWKHA